MYPYVPEHTADDVTGSLPIRCVLSGIGMAFFTTSVTTSVTIKMSNYSEVQEFFSSQHNVQIYETIVDEPGIRGLA